MIKKYVILLFFLFSYLTMGFHSFAEAKNKEVESIEPNEKTAPLKKDDDFIQLEEEFDILDNERMDSDEESNTKNMQKEGIDSDLNCTKDIRYTPAQKKQLDQIYHRIYMDYIALIETYAWSGALTQDQKLLRYNMLRNYILTFQKRNYKWCSEYEEDEWEEEWFNSDND